MQLSSLVLSLLGTVALCPWSVTADGGSYFDFIQPTSGQQFVDGAVNPLEWKKGLLDGVAMIDLELARLNSDGLLFVARNVPARTGKLNLLLQDVPPGDDYFAVFINVTHGFTYAVSPRFTILASSSSASPASPLSGAPTVTVSGGPNPTAPFATTFPASANGAQSKVGVLGAEGRARVVGVISLVGACVISTVWTLL